MLRDFLMYCVPLLLATPIVGAIALWCRQWWVALLVGLLGVPVLGGLFGLGLGWLMITVFGFKDGGLFGVPGLMGVLGVWIGVPIGLVVGGACAWLKRGG